MAPSGGEGEAAAEIAVRVRRLRRFPRPVQRPLATRVTSKGRMASARREDPAQERAKRPGLQ